jgi:hypothetical protein
MLSYIVRHRRAGLHKPIPAVTSEKVSIIREAMQVI